MSMYLTPANPRKKLAETISLEEVMKKAGSDPFNTFDDWTLEDVRRRAVENLPNFKLEDSWQSDWATARIRELIAQEEKKPRPSFWPRILNWSIFDSELPLAHQSLESAIAFTSGLNSPYDFVLRTVAKEVAGGIYHRPELYWFTPSMDIFLKKLLSMMDKNRNSQFTYNEQERHCIERAVRIIVQVKDVSFLDKIEELLSWLQNGEIKPGVNRAEDNFDHVQFMAFLKEAVKILKKAENEQRIDISLLGIYLSDKAGLEGSVIPRLYYPERVKSDGERTERQIRLELKLTHPEEKNKLISVLQEHTLEFCGEGFLNPEAWDKEDPSEYAINRPHCLDLKFLNLACNFFVFPSKGNNRFHLNLKSGKERVKGAVTGYIFVE